MPLIVSGYVAVSTRALAPHAGHTLGTDATGAVLWCEVCRDAAGKPLEIERERRRESLPCGCDDAADHAEGVRLQDKMRADFRIPRSTCVGCYIGDDGPSIHSCVIHDRRYWA